MTKSVEIYKNGSLQTLEIYMSYPDNNGKICKTEFIDYTKRFDNSSYSYYLEEIACNSGIAKKYWVRKNKKGKWEWFRIYS